MEDKQQAKDVAALFERVGQATGKYQEFGPKRLPTLTESDLPALPASMRPLSAPAPLAHPQPGAMLPELDRVLAWNVQHRRLASVEKRAATIALFSLAGGVGKTTIAAALTRILAGRSRRVVLANCAGNFAVHYLRDARSQKMGAFTFLHAPQGASALPMTLIDAGEAASEEDTTELMQQAGQYADHSFLDMPVTLSSGARAMLGAADHVLIPLVPDVHSALTLKAVKAELRAVSAAGVEVHYVLNRYDPGRSLHREMLDQFETMLGSALLPIHIREEPRIQDAMRHCVTIVDYAPEAEVILDLQALGQWSEKLLPRTPAQAVPGV